MAPGKGKTQACSRVVARGPAGSLPPVPAALGVSSPAQGKWQQRDRERPDLERHPGTLGQLGGPQRVALLLGCASQGDAGVSVPLCPVASGRVSRWFWSVRCPPSVNLKEVGLRHVHCRVHGPQALAGEALYREPPPNWEAGWPHLPLPGAAPLAPEITANPASTAIQLFAAF